MKRLWLDTHNHISEYNYTPANTRRPNLFGELSAVLDQCDGDLRMVVMIDMDGQAGHYWYDTILAQPGGAGQSNRTIAEIVRRDPKRLFGACTVNPLFLAEAHKTMDECFGKGGFVMLGEMLQYMIKYKMNSPAVRELVRRAVEFDVPTHVHVSTSNNNGEAQVADICDLFDVEPKAKFILAHAVGLDKQPPVVDTYLNLVERRYGRWPENFWIEIRDFNSPGVPSVLQRVPVGRIISGTDWTTRVGPPFDPFGTLFGLKNPPEFPPCVGSIVKCLRAAGASEEVIERIGWKNAAELLRVKM